MLTQMETGLEHKFARFGEALTVQDGTVIEGYASLFGVPDQGGDIVEPGAYGQSLDTMKAAGSRPKMLWQHDAAQPIGVWEKLHEDAKGLWVKGRLLDTVAQGREAIALISAGAVDGLSIGYRTLVSQQNDKGQRILKQLELWEVSVVTFPMLSNARVLGKDHEARAHRTACHRTENTLRELAATLRGAGRTLAVDPPHFSSHTSKRRL